MFLESIDASSIKKDAEQLCDLLDNVVMEMGVKNVIHVVTDNAANYVIAGKMLVERHCTPSIAHWLDFIIQDIGKNDWVKKILD